EVEAAHRRGRRHRIAFGELHADALARAEQLEQRPLHRMVGTGRVAWRGTDAAVALRDQRRIVESLVGRIAPALAPHALVQPFGEGAAETAGEALEHASVVAVVRRLEPGELGLDAQPGGNREGADPVRDAGVPGCDEVRQAPVRLARRALVLLAQAVP